MTKILTHVHDTAHARTIHSKAKNGICCDILIEMERISRLQQTSSAIWRDPPCRFFLQVPLCCACVLQHEAVLRFVLLLVYASAARCLFLDFSDVHYFFLCSVFFNILSLFQTLNFCPRLFLSKQLRSACALLRFAFPLALPLLPLSHSMHHSRTHECVCAAWLSVCASARVTHCPLTYSSFLPSSFSCSDLILMGRSHCDRGQIRYFTAHALSPHCACIFFVLCVLVVFGFISSVVLPHSM